MKFSEIYGHADVKKVLMQAADSGRIGHAYIFEGISGVGRMSTAKAFAQRLVCEVPHGGESCGECKNCAMSAAGSHPDIRVITNQLYDESKKSTDILVDTVRNMKNEIFIKPYMAQRKVYIVPKADTMNIHAQNSLLKVLEEPPLYCTIILIAENASLFLPTVLSRSVRVKFSPVEVDTVKRCLLENIGGMTEKTAEAKASMCGGSIGRARDLVEDEAVDVIRNETVERISALADSRHRPIYDMTLFLKRNKAEIDFILDIMQSLFRDLMYMSESGGGSHITNKDKKGELERLTAKIYKETPLCLLDTVLKYRACLAKNISYASVAQCMSMEIWEAIHDRSYRCKIQ